MGIREAMGIRKASSVVVHRGGEVYLVRRAEHLRFFGGFWAFPGGTVTPSTANQEDSREALAFREAAARELFEELGVELWSPGLGGDRDPLRRELLRAEGAGVAGRAESHAIWTRLATRVALATEQLVEIARLLTPAYHPVRYDTVFFRLDIAGRESEPDVWPGELEEGRWDPPRVWLARWRAGEIRIAPPVLLILHELSSAPVPDLHWERLATLTETYREGSIHTIFYNPAAQLLPLVTETLPPATHTNAYLVGSDPAYLIDPGAASAGEQERLGSALDRALGEAVVPRRRLGGVLLTHHHRDHVGAADFVRHRHEVPVLAHAETAARLGAGAAVPVTVDRHLAEGDRLSLGPAPDGTPDWELEVLHTPGHAPGHLVFFERRYGSLFVGDMVSTLSSVLIRRKDGDMRAYMDSLARLAALPGRVVYPAHGPAATNGPAVLEAQIRHRQEREEQILEAIAGRDRGGLASEEIVRQVYRDVPAEVVPFALESLESVLEKLREEGRVEPTAGRWRLSRPATLSASDRNDRRGGRARMKPKQRIAALREVMANHQLDAYLVPTADAHQSEYVPECWQRRAWLSGFTGSAGDLLVFAGHVGLWTDGRYFLQAAEELRGSGVELYRSGQTGVPTLEQVLKKKLPNGGRVGADPRTLSIARAAALAKALAEHDAQLVLPDENLVDRARGEIPALPQGEVRALPGKYTGESVTSKLRRLRAQMKEEGAGAHVLSALDAIAWLFNIRGRDVSYNPVVIAYAVVTPNEATLFIDEAKITPAVRKTLLPRIAIRPYGEFGDALRALGAAGTRVWVDRTATSRWMLDQLGGASILERTSPVTLMKSSKNGVEIDGMRAAHVRDGVAMVRFLHWLESAVPKGDVTEISAADQLEAYRREGDLFQGLSFPTISGYGEHGAIIHYRVSPETNVGLRPEGIYLVDSGGQYLDGTTDITRTVLLGPRATREQKDRFTRVLKGHIALSRARFPKGTHGIALDSFARKALWDVQLDYNHGTGHGVGCFLNVHEGPRSIANRPDAGFPLEAGNVFSNEPGYYKPGEYGLRIENLILVVEEGTSEDNGKTYFRFEDLTVCPIDTRLVDAKLLDPDEKKWLNAYHQRVKKTLSPLLEKDDRAWLARACEEI